MPIPTPAKGEPRSKYVSRCMDAIGSEYKNKDQALAVCYSKFKRASSATKPCCDACAEGHTCNQPTNVILANEATILTVFRAKVEEKLIAGVKYLTFPIVMATEGVRQAANSPAPELILRRIFEPALLKQQRDDLKASIEAGESDEVEDEDKPKKKRKKSSKDWQLKLVYTHPKRGDDYVSVDAKHDKDTGVLIGYVNNVRWDGGKLVGNAHLNLKLADKAGADMVLQVERIRQRNVVEVSLGHSAIILPISGTFRGKKFYGTHMEPLLDHIAILRPWDKGACSVKDGCGTPRE